VTISRLLGTGEVALEGMVRKRKTSGPVRCGRRKGSSRGNRGIASTFSGGAIFARLAGTAANRGKAMAA